jgi:hypothetical protein
MVTGMREDDRPRADLRALLERVEAGSPTEAIEVVAHELAAMVGARAVSFLIADFTGRALVRFGASAPGVGERRQGSEYAETVQLTGTVYDRVLRTQQVDVHKLEDGARLTVPVTDRGDAIGVLELILRRKLASELQYFVVPFSHEAAAYPSHPTRGDPSSVRPDAR